jgi:sigma-B regulation protein RsbU (phosphoserine phosphatase)
VLHVPQITVFLRASDQFYLRHSVGLRAGGPLLLSENSSAVQEVLRSNRPAILYREDPEQWFIEADDEEKCTLNELQVELVLALPGRERLMGLMALGRKQSEQPYSPSDLRLLQSVGVQTGLALEVSELAQSLASEAAQRARIDREIEIAREVQQRLFPQRIPVVPGVSLAGLCRPAQAVGGDYYDLIELEQGRLGIAVGDVSGKGISAALLMASLRACLRTMTLLEIVHLSTLMERMNQLVYESSAVNRYATFFFAVYDPAARQLQYVNAGHNAPVLLRASANGAIRRTRLDAGGPVIGLLAGVKYEEQRIDLEAGDLLVAYTDGISEAMTLSDEEWGEERMLLAAESARRGSAEEIVRTVFKGADAFTAGAPQHDDMTLLVLKLLA